MPLSLPPALACLRWSRSAHLRIALQFLLVCTAIAGVAAVWSHVTRPKKPVVGIVIPPYVSPPLRPPFPGELAFDRLYYINMRHRTDRLEQIHNEFASLGWLNKSELVVAAAVPSHGAVGCVRSHLRALRRFLSDPTARHALIIEDDVEFTSDPRVNITRFLADHGNEGWDILMLASNTLREEPYVDYATHILEAQTTSAYAVTRAFASTVIEVFEEGERQLMKTYDPVRFAADMIWKPLQPVNRWYCLAPRVARQRTGFSDIEKGTRAYNA